MNETKPPGMKALTFQPFLRRGGAISKISQQRMTAAGHVYTNLMGAAGLQFTENVGVALIGGQQPLVGDSRLGIFLCDGHTLSVDGVAANGTIHSATGVFEAAVDYGFIFPA